MIHDIFAIAEKNTNKTKKRTTRRGPAVRKTGFKQLVVDMFAKRGHTTDPQPGAETRKTHVRI